MTTQEIVAQVRFWLLFIVFGAATLFAWGMIASAYPHIALGVLIFGAVCCVKWERYFK
jgi:hypothetical protein